MEAISGADTTLRCNSMDKVTLKTIMRLAFFGLLAILSAGNVNAPQRCRREVKCAPPSGYNGPFSTWTTSLSRYTRYICVPGQQAWGYLDFLSLPIDSSFKRPRFSSSVMESKLIYFILYARYQGKWPGVYANSWKKIIDLLATPSSGAPARQPLQYLHLNWSLGTEIVS